MKRLVRIYIFACTLLVLAIGMGPLAFGDVDSPWSGGTSATCGAHNQILRGVLPWAIPPQQQQPLSDENSIGGVVKLSDGTPVAGAFVIVLGVGATVTDAQGAFLLSLPPSLASGTQFTAIIRKQGVSLPATIDLTKGFEARVEATTADGGVGTPASCRERLLVKTLFSITRFATELQQHVISEFNQLSAKARVSMLSVSNRSVEQLNTVLFGAAAFPTTSLACPRREARCTSLSLRGRKRVLRSAVTALRAEALLVNRVLVNRALRSESGSVRAKRRARRLQHRALQEIVGLPNVTSQCSSQ